MHQKKIRFTILFLIWNIYASDNEKVVVKQEEQFLTIQTESESKKTNSYLEKVPALTVTDQHNAYNTDLSPYKTKYFPKTITGVIGNSYIFFNVDQEFFTKGNNTISLSPILKDYTVMALYSAPVNVTNNNSYNAIFSIIQKKKLKKDGYDTYAVFPNLINNENVQTFLTGLKKSHAIPLKSSNSTLLYTKAHLYIDNNQKIMNNIIFYAFLHATHENRTNIIDIAQFCASNVSFKKIACIDIDFVNQEIKKFFHLDHDEVFYNLYKSEIKNKDGFILSKENFNNHCYKISILDTLCKKENLQIKAQFLIKIILGAKIGEETITTPPFYGYFSTYLPWDKSILEKDVTWKSTFFTILSNNTFDQPLFFLADTNAMARHDVLPIEAISQDHQSLNSQSLDNPTIHIITSIDAEKGFIARPTIENNMSSVPFIDQNENNLALTCAQENCNPRFTTIHFHPTEYLTILLNKFTNESFSQKTTSAHKTFNIDTILDLISSLIENITFLQKQVQQLSEQNKELSMQHNDLFSLKKAIKQKITDSTKIKEKIISLKKELFESIKTAEKNFNTKCSTIVKEYSNELEGKKTNFTTELSNMKKEFNTALENRKKKFDDTLKLLQKDCNQSIDNLNKTFENYKNAITNAITDESTASEKKLKQMNTYLLTGGIAAGISIVLLVFYIHKMHVRINTLEKLILHV